MTIHIVQSGETIHSIAEFYAVPVHRLILENGLTNPYNLAVGQTIVIIPPQIVYTVQPDDNLEDIAYRHGISLMDLLRNNPYLSERNSLHPGEILVIAYQSDKTRSITTNGFAFSYITRGTLQKTLPFLSYLTLFNYTATPEGDIISKTDDTELIQLAKIYGTSPMMFLSSITEEGTARDEVTYKILRDPVLQERLLINILNEVRTKGFHGININAENINLDNIDLIIEYMKKISFTFRSEGYRILLTIPPSITVDTHGVSFAEIDYSRLADLVDAIIFSSYDWASSYSYPSAFFPVNLIRDLLDYVVSIIPPEKIILGITTLGYNWPLPYVPGDTAAVSISYDNAIQLAVENNVSIQFNEAAQAPYFYYQGNDSIMHIVWFKDARSFESRAALVEEYGLQGLSIWTIMRFEAQMWFIFNNQYYIEKF